MKNLKVLQIRASGQILGAERVILELSRDLPNYQIDSIIGIPHEKGDPIPEFATTAQKMGFVVELIPISGAFDLSAISYVKELVTKHKVDIVHTHGYREDLYAIGCKKLAGLVATNHLWKRTDWKLKLYAFLDALLLRFFDHIVAVSKPVRQDMIDAGIRSSKITVVPNGINVSAYGNDKNTQQVKSELGLALDHRIIGTVSSLTTEKGIRYAIEALPAILSAHKNVTLLVVGDGDLSHSLKELSKTLNVHKHVVFAGRRSDIPDILACMDIFLLASLAEGLPMALLEAMASGLPVIATNVGDVSDVVNEDVGYLIDPADEKAIADSAISLLNSTEAMQLKGKNAADKIASRFSSDSMTLNYAKIYSSNCR